MLRVTVGVNKKMFAGMLLKFLGSSEVSNIHFNSTQRGWKLHRHEKLGLWIYVKPIGKIGQRT